MATWSILYGSEELQLSNRNPFDVVSVQGIGGAIVRRLMERSPLQDGAIDVGRRIDSRLINVVLFFAGTNPAAADAHRDLLYDWLKPHAEPLQLRCRRDDGSDRRIDVHPLGMVDAPITADERWWGAQKLALQLQAADPIWYDPQPQTWGLLGGAGTGNSGFSVPLFAPWVQVTQTFINTTQTLHYLGSWDEYPVITFWGPASGITLRNVTTGETLDFPTLALANGHWLRVDLRYGHKTVFDDYGVNQLGALSTQSDLATWHLASAPDAPGGENVLRFEVDAAASDATGVHLAYRHRYIGL